MIAVIADDYTGAAEIAGLGLRYGLKAILQREFTPVSDIDLLVLATNTRDKSENDAFVEVRNLTHKIVELKPSLIFKKIDSALRGHILAETKAIMTAAEVDNVLIVGGNPSLKRTIKEGKYFINEVPLHKSGFETDPYFPMLTNNVTEIIGASDSSIHLLNGYPRQPLPECGLVIGDVGSNGDLNLWSEQMKPGWLPVGSSVFFEAILKTQGFTEVDTKASKMEATRLMILGSMFPKSDEYFHLLKASGFELIPMPDDVYLTNNSKSKNEWVRQIMKQLQHGSVVLCTPVGKKKDPGRSSMVGGIWSETVKSLVDQSRIDEMLIEGGSTLAGILETLDITQMTPVNEFAPGVIRMKPKGKYNFVITSKPGSYHWSDKILDEKPQNVT